MNLPRLQNQFYNLLKDERGGEVLEYALIAGLIVIAAISLIGAVGSKVAAKWTSLNSKM
jgi:Flp pilus assembly pilin Flp